MGKGAGTARPRIPPVHAPPRDKLSTLQGGDKLSPPLRGDKLSTLLRGDKLSPPLRRPPKDFPGLYSACNLTASTPFWLKGQLHPVPLNTPDFEVMSNEYVAG